MALQRFPDWPERLMAAVKACDGKPYAYGSHDCFTFACAAVAAMTGTDFYPRFAGYTTKREALRRIARIAPSYGDAVTEVLGIAPTPVASAWRGDVVIYRDATGQDHLGVCMGRMVLFPAEVGTAAIALDHPGLIASWRIG